jgi:DNA-binding NtrC family response regulator
LGVEDRTDGSFNSRLILIVDDDPTVRALLVRVMSLRGHQPLAAGNGMEALDLVYRHGATIGAILTDVRMPIMDGYELAAALAESHPDIPVAMMSSHFDVRAVELLANVKSVIRKPFSIDAVGDRLERMLDYYPERAEA